MIKKMLCVGAILGMLCMLPVRTQASQGGGCIRINLNVGDLAVTNGAFTLYRVGIQISDGYRIMEDFGGGFVRQEDALSPHLAQWLTEMDPEQGKTVLLDADGNVAFSQLGEGLYLVAQTEMTDGFYPIQPFLMTVPRDGRWDIQVNTEPLPRIGTSPATGDEDMLALGILGMTGSAMGIGLCAARKKQRV